jgi:hypothetical protein
MSILAIRTGVCAVSILMMVGASLAHGQTMDHGGGASTMPGMPSADASASPATQGQILLERVRGLEGKWDAQTKLGVLTDIFQPFAMGTDVLMEEWINGKQITSTIFYVVNGELRADHFCDYLNQPRYTAVPSVDPSVLDFEFREATNLDTHPAHFHTAKWTIVDGTHLNQEWLILGGKKPVSQIHMQFTKRGEGMLAPDPTEVAASPGSAPPPKNP